ncbi:MAG: hypothetical protein WAT67_01085 [Candidatus Contendobacter sp.]
MSDDSGHGRILLAVVIVLPKLQRTVGAGLGIITNHSDNRLAMLANQVANFASGAANRVAICASLLKLGIGQAIVVG